MLQQLAVLRRSRRVGHQEPGVYDVAFLRAGAGYVTGKAQEHRSGVAEQPIDARPKRGAGEASALQNSLWLLIHCA